jgi:hypothetical protein
VARDVVEKEIKDRARNRVRRVAKDTDRVRNNVAEDDEGYVCR